MKLLPLGHLQVPPRTPVHVCAHIAHGCPEFSATGLGQGIAVRLALAGCWEGADVDLHTALGINVSVQLQALLWCGQGVASALSSTQTPKPS